MSERRVVVDGSNIATEGRAMPSLAQLREAVAAFRAENPDDTITVVVDATFSYRIDASERAAFEEARTTGELVSVPAGAVGRGDGFLLQIADRTAARVLSNDSFQEYHGTYSWLFDQGRLIGGSPVPGVGWIFTVRTPVRGPRSREAVRVAKKASRPAKKAIDKPIAKAIEEATAEASKPSRRGRRRRGTAAPSEPVNEPMAFLEFVAAHPVGSEVEGTIDRFSSHGAFVMVGPAQCYIPLSAMGEPAPRRARDIVRMGETRSFVVQALDPPRRGIELALPGFAHPAAAPTEETVEAEILEAKPEPTARQSAKKKAPATKKAPARTAPAKKKAPAGTAPAKKKAPAGTAPAKKKAAAPAPASKAPAKRASAKKREAPPITKAEPPAKKAGRQAPTKKAAAKKATAQVKKATAQVKKATAQVKKAAKKAAPVKKAAKKTAVPPRKAAPTKSAPPAKKAAKQGGRRSR
jgi:hypothetical protein